MNKLEVLIKARSLVEVGWVSGLYHGRIDSECDSRYWKAEPGISDCYCAIGAVHAILDHGVDEYENIPREYFRSDFATVARRSDKSRESALALFDEAIAAAELEEAGA